ncbi:PTS transporter subunit EIIC [Dysgonomonas sp. ZJ279]|uniref:PTS transporter subunit EIIC n=1 Tax=Dysgonomonas sp. ZJ279 TaxID=2709796 RepID=UPI0013EE2EEC|nr:PTS transporter subunit EIIC [Dysgonomonas sp. ZJ279]
MNKHENTSGIILLRSKLNPKRLLDSAIDVIAGLFLPIVNILSAAGIMKGILAILLTTGVVMEATGTFHIFYAIADACFYFLPVFLAITAAKKFGTNVFTAVLIALILLSPGMIQLMQSKDEIALLGIPIIPVTYFSSVIPIILSIFLLKYTETLLIKILPEVIRELFTPLLSILIIVPATLFLFGPIGAVVGDVMANGYSSVYNWSPILAGIVIGGLIQLMVIFGFHWSLVPMALNNIVLYGSDTILPLFAGAAFAQAGASFAVCLKTKNKKLKTISFSAGISSLFGITEPALFGVTLPLKRPLIIVCIAGAIAGGVAGASGATAMSFAFPGLATIPVFLGQGFLGFLIACALGFTISFILTYLIKFDERAMDKILSNK